MLKFKNNKMLLLKALREIVTENMDHRLLETSIEQDVAEFLTEIKDKKRYRRLKSIRKELDRWINEKNVSV